MIIKKINEFRLVDKMNIPNDGTRSLMESIIMPEVILALNDWINNQDKNNYVLIGGLALSYYVKPRSTTDVDILFLDVNKKIYTNNQFI